VIALRRWPATNVAQSSILLETVTNRKERNNQGRDKTRPEKLALNVELKAILREIVATQLLEVRKEREKNAIIVEESDIFREIAQVREKFREELRNAISVIKKDI
jgi:predicted butyrate kinase (DUF1464 family)